MRSPVIVSLGVIALWLAITAATTIIAIQMANAFIEITSPRKNQQVSIGSNLAINGNSIANATSNCQVSVIVNKVKPYQNATAAGPGGPADFSKWKYVLSPSYTRIKQGQNKITSRLSCVNTPAVNSSRFYSINVTGVAPGSPSVSNSSIQAAAQPSHKQSQSTTTTITRPPPPRLSPPSPPSSSQPPSSSGNQSTSPLPIPFNYLRTRIELLT